MIDTIIVSGGNIQNGFALDFLKLKQKEALPNKVTLIAADKGVEFFIKNNLTPDIAVGDFDSLSEDGKKHLETLNSTEIIYLKPEKDDSDTQSAVNLAIKRGAKRIMIFGATGTRIDHVFANLGLLVMGKEQNVDIILVDAYNQISLITDHLTIKKENQFGEYVSFFPIGGVVKGLTLTGFKYPLKGYDLKASDSGLTVSNEIKDEIAAVELVSGNLLMIMSRD